jgi:hypothetical protein
MPDQLELNEELAASKHVGDGRANTAIILKFEADKIASRITDKHRQLISTLQLATVP